MAGGDRNGDDREVEDERLALQDLSAATAMDERLREVARDAPRIERAVVAARAALAEARRERDSETEMRLLGYLGDAYRILGRHDDAVAACSESMRLAAAAPPRARVVAAIRLGEALRCADALGDAEATLGGAVAEARTHAPDVLHFALQHLGKCVLDGGRPEEAVRHLEEALALRRAQGDPGLIASTQAALTAAYARLG